MTWLALAIALQQGATSTAPAVPSWYGGRFLTTAHVHGGARPALFVDNEGPPRGQLEAGIGATLQVTVDWP